MAVAQSTSHSEATARKPNSANTPPRNGTKLAPILLLGLLILLPTPSFSQQIITFPDPVLEQAIRDRLDKPSGDILDTDMLQMTYLSVPPDGLAPFITDLTGLEYAVNLTQPRCLRNGLSEKRRPWGFRAWNGRNELWTCTTEKNLSRMSAAD